MATCAPPTPAIGIDLGTATSCVGVFQNGKVDIIANDHGNRTTPSCVGFAADARGRFLGDDARNQATRNPGGTVFAAKRVIDGRLDVLPVAGDQKINVEFEGKRRTFYPEEISSMVLLKMKQIAETYLGKVGLTLEHAFNNP